MKKTFNFGSVDYNKTGKHFYATVELELIQSAQGPIFFASGTIANKRHKTANNCGQCLETIAEHIQTEEFMEILDLWRKYHLNHFHAGTPKQEAAIDAWIAEGNKYDYNEVMKLLRSKGLDYDERNGKPYLYGSRWLFLPIPNQDLLKIEKLMGIERPVFA